MTYQFNPLIITFAVNGFVAIIFAFFGWSRRVNPGGRSFALLMAAIAVWSLCRALEAAAVQPDLKVFWGRAEYFGIATAGLLWLLFTAEFARKDQWFTKKRLILLGLLPAATIVMAFTNDLHGLIWTSITPAPGSAYNLLVYRHGAWFWLAMAYNYATFIAGTVILLRAFRYYSRLYRLQAVLVAVGAVLPIIGNVLYVSGLTPVPGLDLTHFGFTGTGLIFSLTIFRYRMFDMRQLARDIVIEETSDGVVVVDGRSRIVDMNPAAKRMFGTPAFLALGMSVEKAAATWSELTASGMSPPHEQTEINLGDRAYRVAVSALSNQATHAHGRVLFIRDVTEERQAREIIGKSEERFRDLYENAPIAYFSVGADGIIRLCNRKAAQLLGADAADLPGRSIFDFVANTPDGTGKADEIVADARAGAVVADSELEMERADGTAAWVSLTVTPLGRAAGRTEEYRLLAADVTSRKKIEQERELLISELKQAAQEIKTLSGLLHACSGCRRILDEKGNWVNLELFVSRHTEADFTHGICPECIQKLYPGLKQKSGK